MAATEDVVAEDGTIDEVSQGLGYRRVDAPDLVSEALGVTSQSAGRKVDEAVLLASKLPDLVDAMGAGRVDAYRAGIIADELRDAPRAVCDLVLARLDRSLHHPGGVLRRRTRHALTKVDKRYLITRTRRARSELGLRMVPNDDSTDTWTAVLPTEESRQAWAAIEPLAKQIRDTEGCTLDLARAKAMTQLMLGNCTGVFHVHLAVPAAQAEEFATRLTGLAPDPTKPETTDPECTAADHVAPDDEPVLAAAEEPEWAVVTGMSTIGTTIVPCTWLGEVLDGQHGVVEVEVIGCDPTTGGFVTDPIPVSSRSRPDRRTRSMANMVTTAYQPTAAYRAYVKARDQRCRFPGCAASAYFCDLDQWSFAVLAGSYAA